MVSNDAKDAQEEKRGPKDLGKWPEGGRSGQKNHSSFFYFYQEDLYILLENKPLFGKVNSGEKLFV